MIFYFEEQLSYELFFKTHGKENSDLSSSILPIIPPGPPPRKRISDEKQTHKQKTPQREQKKKVFMPGSYLPIFKESSLHIHVGVCVICRLWSLQPLKINCTVLPPTSAAGFISKAPLSALWQIHALLSSFLSFFFLFFSFFLSFFLFFLNWTLSYFFKKSGLLETTYNILCHIKEDIQQ